MNHARRTGMIAALSTYLIWGVLPLYWNLLARAEANEILAHRIIWSFVFMVVVLMVTKRWQSFKEDCRALWQDKKRGAILLLAAFTISLNWLTYIWAVNYGHVIDTSIGYYINPLMSVLFGIVFFRERISGLKKISLLLAAIGIVLMTYQLGKLPWVAVVLAVSFSVYGALKKQLHLNPFSSITLETLLMVPFAVPYIGILMMSPANHFSLATPDLALYLMGTGVVTAVPLVLFSYGANLLPLNVLGFFQYISPTIGLLLGIFFFHETFGMAQISALGFVWAAIVLFTVAESLRGR
ncbi:EamA family transporter RarD [uncultured Mitsuokella sp.]|uniref:EamA family transporter RarD n=1 Tax=uncultured Mitsuokella sp. TaxID=453120 RepID=UPI00259AD432|nr:EamA family transporter RarD [uncultured Mitsuokella sp.]